MSVGIMVGAAEVEMRRGMRRINVRLGGGVVVPHVPVSEGPDWASDWREWMFTEAVPGGYGTSPFYRQTEALKALPAIEAIKAWGEQWRTKRVRRTHCPHCGGRL